MRRAPAICTAQAVLQPLIEDQSAPATARHAFLHAGAHAISKQQHQPPPGGCSFAGALLTSSDKNGNFFMRDIRLRLEIAHTCNNQHVDLSHWV